MKIFNLHPDMNLLSQPFNEMRHQYAEDRRNYSQEVKTVRDLNRVLDEIQLEYNGFKTFAFQLPENLNKYLLTRRNYKILFLHRRNYLQSAISKFIAEQTKIWTADEKERQGNQLNALARIDINVVKDEIEYLKSDCRKYLEFLAVAKIQVFDALYEDIFVEQKDQRFKKIESLFGFLGLKMPPEMVVEVQRILSPIRKINSEETYNLIPNIREIEEGLGSSENGYLFK